MNIPSKLSALMTIAHTTLWFRWAKKEVIWNPISIIPKKGNNSRVNHAKYNFASFLNKIATNFEILPFLGPFMSKVVTVS
jgi:hypothetical protein